ncbi:MAG: DMT family transporter [Pseudomonadota bacterium]
MTKREHALWQTAGLTILAMVAFAANSVLGRLGLLEGGIGPGSFAVIRIVSGALILMLLSGWSAGWTSGSWREASALFVYASFFAYAYLTLAAGTGALILFAVVQITMLGTGIALGERLNAAQWSGVALAIAGMAWLVSPSLEAPSPIGTGLMTAAGIGWGIYSLLGRRAAGSPTARTAGNFARASLIALLLVPIVLFLRPEPVPATYGISLAIASGAITSGLGYAVWYAALKNLSAVRAGVAQLSVPAIAALGGVLFLAEPVTWRFAGSSLVILGGIALTTFAGSKSPRAG